MRKNTVKTRKVTPFRNTGKVISREKINIFTDSLSFTIFKDERFEAVTRLERLNQGADCYGTLMRYNDYIVFAQNNYKKEVLVAIYEFIGGPDDSGFGICENKVRLIALIDRVFEDSGHAAVEAIRAIQENMV